MMWRDCNNVFLVASLLVIWHGYNLNITHRRKSDQTLYAQLLDRFNKPINDFVATDEDDPDSVNGKVTFSIVGDETSMEYFRMIGLENNKGRLQLVQQLNPDKIKYEVKIQASDNGTEPRKSTRDITVVRINTNNVPPRFENSTQTLYFPENSTGMTKLDNFIEEATDDNNNGLPPNDIEWQNISYRIIGGNSNLFNLDATTRLLTLKEELDYEMQTNHSLTIQAFDDEDRDPVDQSLLQVTVQVVDINDMPPRFKTQLFPGGFTTTDKIDKVIISLDADDPDTEDELKYAMDLVTVTDNSLESIKDQAFYLNPETGNITLTFDPANRDLKGYFTFRVEVRDSMDPPSEDHKDTAMVQINIISSSNLMTFKFLNQLDEIVKERNTISSIFGNVLECVCGIDKVAWATETSGVPSTTKTDIDAHFLDNNNTLIEKDQISNKFMDTEIFGKLQRELISRKLMLQGYDLGTSSAENNLQEYLQIVLICVSAVLGVMVVVLFVAFFVRTRTLNRRLEKLSTTKFGSQDSGLNRVGMAVPNTNRHAIEGSNPVWNEDVGPDYDNMSQGSGDSDLIGIEDNPEFSPYGISNENPNSMGSGHRMTNAGFNPGPEVGFERRASVNPLSNLAGEGAGARRASLNPLSPSFEASISDEHMPTNNNFSFRRMDSVPATEL